MPQVVIENPILNSPFAEPSRHFRIGEQSITDEIAEGRRESLCFIPIPQEKKKTQQIAFDTEWTRDRIQENDFINSARAALRVWRQAMRNGRSADLIGLQDL
jgi:type III restriction enzyme